MKLRFRMAWAILRGRAVMYRMSVTWNVSDGEFEGWRIGPKTPGLGWFMVENDVRRVGPWR